MRPESNLTAVKSPDRVQPVQPLQSLQAAPASAAPRVQQPCCMSSTRKLARLAAPVVCAAYVTYVAIDRGYYHIERRKELDAATVRASNVEDGRHERRVIVLEQANEALCVR